MRRIARLTAALAACLAPLFAVAASPEMAPFRPALTLDTDPALCAPFLAAWTAGFDGPARLDREPPDLTAAYPGDDLIGLSVGNTSSGVVFAYPIDLDGDGADEVLHVEADTIRYHTFVDLYVFASPDAYSRARSAYGLAQAGGGGPAFHGYARGAAWTGPRPALNLGPLFRGQVLRRGGVAYTMPALPYLDRPRPGEPVVATLYRLQAEGAPLPACTVDILPGVEVFDDFARDSAVFAALKAMYGPSPARCGYVVSPPPEAEAHLFDIFFRPQVMQPWADRADPARELRLMSWGLSDPNSWDVYLRLKAGRADFLRDMAAYYRRHFADTDTDTDAAAEALAQTAYRFLVDRVVYGTTGYLPYVANAAPEPLPITVDMPPAEIAAVALAALRDRDRDGTAPRAFEGDEIWREAALLAILTRQPPGTVRAVVTHFLAESAARHVKGELPQHAAHLAARREVVLGTALAAALGDEGLMELLLELGADVNARTNAFGKTPLMYAAQRDELAAARWLLERGADPARATDNELGRRAQFYMDCQSGLDRDHRTALTYAAENASAGLIRLLLDAGADAGAADSRGNPVRWYLERNAGLRPPELASLRARMTR